MRTASCSAFAFASLLAMPLAARADLVATVNAIRADGCGKSHDPAPLRHEAALDHAAELLASGRKLAQAMADSGYLAVRSAMLEVEGKNSAAMAKTLAARGCADITDPGYREFGIASRATSAWVVLAAPLSPPSAGEAEGVGRRALALVNAARASARRCGRKKFEVATPLVLSAPLGRAARAQAEDMAAHGKLGHSGSDGSTPASRATHAGYRWRLVGENVAAGQPTPEEVVAEWLDSAGHCANIMDPRYAEMGIAFAIEPHGRKGIYWSQVFGAPAP